MLLCEAWASTPKPFLPDDRDTLIDMAKADESHPDFESDWAYLMKQFETNENGLYHTRQLEEHEMCNELREKRSNAGKASAKARADKAPPVKQPPTSVEHVLDSVEQEKKEREERKRREEIEEKRRKKAGPPSAEECQNYFIEKNSTEQESSKFMDHFASNGWKVGGKAAMKDWKAAVRTWIARNGTGSAKSTYTPHPDEATAI